MPVHEVRIDNLYELPARLSALEESIGEEIVQVVNTGYSWVVITRPAVKPPAKRVVTR